jgi:hypothetical protein
VEPGTEVSNPKSDTPAEDVDAGGQEARTNQYAKERRPSASGGKRLARRCGGEGGWLPGG